MTNLDFAGILRRRAAERGNERAYTFLEDGERDGGTLTWTELEARSGSIASALRSIVGRRARVLLLFRPGVDVIPAFFGVLRARAVAVLAYPPSGRRTDRVVERLRRICEDAEFSAVVACDRTFAKRHELAAVAPELSCIPWLDSSQLDFASSLHEERCELSDVTLLQYTSGSTSRPRGVMVTHANLLHNLSCSAQLAEHGPDSVGVSWLPINHDMGLIEGVLQPAFSGFPAWLMSPAAFLQRPLRWLQAISRVRATHSGATDFAFELCANRIEASDRASLDLSSWRTAFNGSEPVRSSTLEGFARAFAECGFRWESFRPAYGLAESTLLVASSRAGDEPHVFHADAEALRQGSVEPAGHKRGSVSLVSCGAAAPEVTLAIVDPASRQRCGPGRLGEIWVRSRSVAAGYWNSERDTMESFGARIEPSGEGPFLRTGDLGFVRGGHLFIAGRLKDLLIVRGVKHHPHDVEETAARAHPALKRHAIAAFHISCADQPDRVGIALELDAPGTGETARAALPLLCAAIAQAVATRHGFVPACIVVVTPRTLPRTTSGKLERYRCAELLHGNLSVIHEWTQPAAERERAAS
jgi:acyl-CoA synthetase (AMP-forming)/AMP-acid ligase II